MLRKVMVISVIGILGLLLRGVNLSSYKFYPDAYQNLLVARNLEEYDGVVGLLGERGHLFPTYFMWSRPIYPFLINGVNYFAGDAVWAAELVAFLAGALGIVAGFYLGMRVSGRFEGGMVGAMLVSVSMNHVVYSGMVMSETVAILLSLIYWSLMLGEEKESEWFELKDLIRGGLLGILMFARYEYLVFVPLSGYWLLRTRRRPFIAVMNILAAFSLVVAGILVWWFPISDSIQIIWRQVEDIVYGFMIGAVGLFLLGVLGSRVKLRINWKIISNLFFVLAIILGGVVVFKGEIPRLIGFSGFLKTDWLLTIGAIFGLGVMLRDKEKENLGIFCLMAMLLMGGVYVRINEEMIRYPMHLIPFMLVLAVNFILFLGEILSFRVWMALLLLLFLVQGVEAYQGIRDWSEGDYAVTSYEEESAKRLKEYLKGNEVLVVSMPEPYFFFTGQDTRGVSIYKPYVDERGLDPETELLVVLDLPMWDLFPEFGEVIETKFENEIVGSYETQRAYHYQTRREEEKLPVQVYRIKLSRLLQQLYELE